MNALLRDDAGRNPYGVEGHIEAPGFLDDSGEMLVDGPLVERVDSCRFRLPARSDDVLDHGVDRGEVAAGQEDPRPLAGERASNRTADCSSRSVDGGILALEQHGPSPFKLAILQDDSDQRKDAVSWGRTN